MIYPDDLRAAIEALIDSVGFDHTILPVAVTRSGEDLLVKMTPHHADVRRELELNASFMLTCAEAKTVIATAAYPAVKLMAENSMGGTISTCGGNLPIDLVREIETLLSSAESEQSVVNRRLTPIPSVKVRTSDE